MAFALLQRSLSKLPGSAKSAIKLQTKLKVGAPDDKFEVEADRVADRVMRMPTGQLQRSCSCGGSCSNCRKAPQTESERLQTKSVSSGESGQMVAPPIVHETLSASGKPLDAATRAFMELRFGHDFSQVRLHTDAKDSESVKAMNAVAYTVGQDIVFGAGQYAPGSIEGRRLLAHELSHVVQQSQIQAPHVQRQFAPILPQKLSQSTNYRFDTYQITERDLSDPNVTSRLQGLTKDQLRNYLDHVTDPAVRSYILKLLALPEIDRLRKCTVDDCLEQNASVERVSRIVGPSFDVFGCYGALEERAAKSSLTPEAGCAQCIMGCSKMDLDEAITTCRDALLNSCIEVTNSWKRFTLRGR